MSRAKSDLVVYAELTASMALWGATWVSGRVVAREMTPFAAAFLRFLFASAFLYVLLCREAGQGALAARTRGGWPRPPKGSWRGLFVLALTGVFLYNALFFSGLARIQAGRAAMIVACVPSVVALYAWLILRRPIGTARTLGVGLSLLGVAVILSGGDLASLLVHGVSTGDALILGCLVTWAAYTIAGGEVMRTTTPLSAVAWSCMLGCAMLLPPALAEGVVGQAARANWLIWGNLLFLGVGATGLAFTWYYDGILALGAARASVFLNLVPVFATILGGALLGEAPGHALLLGGGMALCGVALANRRGRAPAAHGEAAP